MSLSVQIKKNFGSFHLEVAFEAENEVLALLGASGCGKSVTLKCIAGIETPDSGRIVLDDRVLFDSEKHINLTPQQRRVGYLFQQYALFPNMTVEQNIMAALHDCPREERREDASRLMVAFHLEGLGKKRPGQLSGGQQQRVALARILASRPQAILLDEPFSALDSYLKWQLENELSDRLAAFGGTTLWVSHDRDEVYRNCRRICVIDEGRSSPVVTMKELFANPGTVCAARLSGCKNFIPFVPQGAGKISIPEWGLCLSCDRTLGAGESVLGLRAHQLRFAAPEEENAFSCRIERMTENVFSMVVMLRPEGALPASPLLRMETNKEDWQGKTPEDSVTIAISSGELLLLHP